MPQGSALGPILFSIYVNDLFCLFKEINVCNFADDTFLFVCDVSLEEIVQKLEHNSEIAIKWFHDNYMNLKRNKCDLLMPGF